MAALHLSLCHQIAKQLLCDQLDGLAAGLGRSCCASPSHYDLVSIDPALAFVDRIANPDTDLGPDFLAHDYRQPNRHHAMPRTSHRLTELEAMIAAAEMNITLLTSVIEARAASGRDTTGLQTLRQSTQRRLKRLKVMRNNIIDKPIS